MPTDIRLYPGETNPNDIRLRSVPAATTGNEGVLCSSTNSIVPYARTILYQALAFVAVVAPEIVTVDKWLAPLSQPIVQRGGLPTAQQPSFAAGFSDTATDHRWFVPLSTPTLRGGLPTAQQPYLSFVKVAPFEEAVSIDKWLQPLSEPVRLRALPTSEQPYLAIGLSDPARDARWFMPLSEPVRWRGLPTSEQPYLAFVKAAPFPETVTADRWAQPLSVPTRLGGLPTASQPYFTIGLSDTSRDNRWFMPLSEPVRWRGLATASQPYLAFVKAAPFPEAVSVDKWGQPLSVPTLRGGLPTPEQPYFTVGLSDTATDHRWLTPLSEPTRRKPTVQPDSLTWSNFTPASTEVVTLDKYHRPFSEPVRFPRNLPVYQQPYLSFVQAAPFTESVTADRWFQPLSLPTRRIVSVAFHPALFWGRFTPAAEIITLDKWMAPLSMPTRRTVSVASQQAFFWSHTAFLPPKYRVYLIA